MINSSKKASFSWLQAYLMTLWHQHLSPTLHITLQKVCLWFIVNLEILQLPFKDKSFLLQVSRKIDQVQKWSEPHIETLNSVSFVLTAHLFTFHVLNTDIWEPLQKWIPSIKDACVTLTIYLEPKVQYLTDKSIEVLYTSKQALKPHLIQGFDASYYYLEVNIFPSTFLRLFVKHIVTIVSFILGNQNTYTPIHDPDHDHNETTLEESTSCLRAI